MSAIYPSCCNNRAATFWLITLSSVTRILSGSRVARVGTVGAATETVGCAAAVGATLERAPSNCSSAAFKRTGLTGALTTRFARSELQHSSFALSPMGLTMTVGNCAARMPLTRGESALNRPSRITISKADDWAVPVSLVTVQFVSHVRSVRSTIRATASLDSATSTFFPRMRDAFFADSGLTATPAVGRGKVKKKVEPVRSEEHTSELQSRLHLVCRLLLEKKKNSIQQHTIT